jgi:hypothetical protein
MKISFLKSLIFIAIALSTFNVNAQNDKIITNSDDTIACKIEGPGVLGVFRYDHIEITKKRIKEFYNASKTMWFRRVVVRHQPTVFMKVVVRGKISIYENVDNYRGDVWFASKNSDTAVSIQSNKMGLFMGNDKRRKLFGDYLQDKKAVYDQYMEIKDPDIEDMLRLAQLYNRW